MSSAEIAAEIRVQGVRALLGAYYRYTFEQKTLFGKDLRVRRGTIPTVSDYDDAWFAFLAADAQTVFDVGCNIGFMTMVSLASNSDSTIVAVDANPLAVAAAAESVVRNGFGLRVSFASAFVGSSVDEAVEFFTVGTGEAGSRDSTHAKTAGRRNRSLLVQSTTIDALMGATGLVPDLIKIDIEGAEIDALKGATAAASEGSLFFVEMHSSPMLSMHENGAGVLRWCDENGYAAYYLAEHARIQAPDVLADRGRCHLLLMPAEAGYPAGLKQISQGDSIDSLTLN